MMFDTLHVAQMPWLATVMAPNTIPVASVSLPTRVVQPLTATPVRASRLVSAQGQHGRVQLGTQLPQRL
jgi:hypothetical protein